MGLIELIKLAFTDDKIFLPTDNEYIIRNRRTTRVYIWDNDEKEDICHIEHDETINKIRELVEEGLPEKPEGEAPDFTMNGNGECKLDE